MERRVRSSVLSVTKIIECFFASLMVPEGVHSAQNKPPSPATVERTVADKG